MSRTPKAGTPAAPVQHDRTQKRQGNSVTALPADPGEGAAAEASPAAGGPPPAQADGDALIAEMAFPVGAGPDRAADPAHHGSHDDAAEAGDAGSPSPSTGAPAPAEPSAAARGDAANPRGRR